MEGSRLRPRRGETMRKTNGGTPLRRRALLAALAAVAALAVALFASASGGAAGSKSSATVGKPVVATLVQTVNVADLPPPSAENLGSLPFLAFHPAALAAAKAAGGAAPAGAVGTDSTGAAP